MKLRDTILLAMCVLLGIASFAQAANELGNGGNVLVCPDVRLFDFYEGEYRYRLNYGLPNSEDMYEILRMAISRLERLNPTRAHQYREWIRTFFDEAEIVEDRLIPVADVGLGRVPPGCELKQLAVQITPRLPNEKRYTIDRQYWDVMSAKDRAGLILHEVILREMRDTVEARLDSVAARFLTVLITSEGFDTLSLRNYLTLLQQMEFVSADAIYENYTVPMYIGRASSTQPRTYSPRELRYYDNGLLSGALQLEGTFFDFPLFEGVAPLKCAYRYGGSHNVYPSGIPYFLECNPEFHYEFHQNGINGDFSVKRLDFGPSGEVIQGVNEGYSIIQKRNNFQAVISEFTTFANGNLKHVSVNSYNSRVYCMGRWFWAPEHLRYYDFDSEGRLTTDLCEEPEMLQPIIQ